MRFRDIPQFTQQSPYGVHLAWRSLEDNLKRYCEESPGLDLDPDFQRGHVWTREQQIAYVEFGFRGGQSGKHILTNCPGWMGSWKGPHVLVDGKQRITAVLAFLHDEIPAFGVKYSEFEDKLSPFDPHFIFCVNTLETRAEVLRWYCELNDGGVVHSPEEIARVRGMLQDELKKESLCNEV